MENPRRFGEEANTVSVPVVSAHTKTKGEAQPTPRKRRRVCNDIDSGLRSDNFTITSNQTPSPLLNSVISQQRQQQTISINSDRLNDGSLLPPMRPSDEGKPTLVLDMDGTILKENNFKNYIICKIDFVLRQKLTGAKSYVSIRPHLEAFLSEMDELFEIVIFTESCKERADVLLDALVNSKYIRHRLYRDSCTEVDGRLVKDLSRLGRDLSKVIIIDDCPFCFALQPSNAIPIAYFSGDRRDCELQHVRSFICGDLNLRPGLKLSTHVDLRYTLGQFQFGNKNQNLANLNGRHLPPMNTCDAGKHTLVLDMDETLLTGFDGRTLAGNPPDFICPGRNRSLEPTAAIYYYKRPGVENFLARMEKLFEIVIFTCSQKWLAEICLGHFENRNCIRFLLSRDSCTQLGEVVWVKDLSLLGRDIRKVIIVDDQPRFYELQQFNGIPIKPFRGHFPDDELTKLIPFLEQLREQEDVRPLIQSQYGGEVELEPYLNLHV